MSNVVEERRGFDVNENKKSEIRARKKKTIVQGDNGMSRGKQLYVKFDYTYKTENFWPLEVNYNKKNYGAKLAWYTNEVENMTVASFLETIAGKINKKYDFDFKQQ